MNKLKLLSLSTLCAFSLTQQVKSLDVTLNDGSYYIIPDNLIQYSKTLTTILEAADPAAPAGRIPIDINTAEKDLLMPIWSLMTERNAEQRIANAFKKINNLDRLNGILRIANELHIEGLIAPCLEQISACLQAQKSGRPNEDLEDFARSKIAFKARYNNFFLEGLNQKLIESLIQYSAINDIPDPKKRDGRFERIELSSLLSRYRIQNPLNLDQILFINLCQKRWLESAVGRRPGRALKLQHPMALSEPINASLNAIFLTLDPAIQQHLIRAELVI